MAQLITAVLSTIALVLFAMANTHDVELSYVVGSPIRIRLIFLLAVAFFAGIVCTLLYQMVSRVASEARRRAYRARERFAMERERGLE